MKSQRKATQERNAAWREAVATGRVVKLGDVTFRSYNSPEEAEAAVKSLLGLGMSSAHVVKEEAR